MQFQTNFEGGVTLEELAHATDCSLEQFLEDSILSVLLCVRTAEENRAEGKQSPTLLLVEHQSRKGYETYDFMEALTGSADALPAAPQLSVEDPFAQESNRVELPLPAAALKELDELSRVLVTPRQRILQQGISLRWILKEAADASLSVLLEGVHEDEYVVVPTTFVD
jgi:hypothetical protein